jgi:hypothetical protein
MNDRANSNDERVAGMITARSAVNAKSHADDVESKLRSEPFWRFRRRRQLGKDLALARAVERSAIAVMGGKPPPRD